MDFSDIDGEEAMWEMEQEQQQQQSQRGSKRPLRTLSNNTPRSNRQRICASPPPLHQQQQQQQVAPVFRMRNQRDQVHEDVKECMNSTVCCMEQRMSGLDPKVKTAVVNFATFSRAAMDLCSPDPDVLDRARTVPFRPTGDNQKTQGRVKVFCKDRIEEGTMNFVTAIVAMQQLGLAHTSLTPAAAGCSAEVLDRAVSIADTYKAPLKDKAAAEQVQQELNYSKWEGLIGMYSGASVPLPSSLENMQYTQSVYGTKAVDRRRLSEALQHMRNQM